MSISSLDSRAEPVSDATDDILAEFLAPSAHAHHAGNTPPEGPNPATLDPYDALYASIGRWNFHASAGFDQLNDEHDGSGVTVGVFDDGFHYNHADLTGRFDLSRDYDFRDNDGNAIAGADDYHGTPVAAVIGAAQDGSGISGPASDATLLGLRQGYGSSGSYTDIIEAFDYAVDRVDVLNNSWGYTSFFSDNANAWWMSDIMQSAADLARDGRGGLGVTNVFSSGNDAETGNDANMHNLQNSIYTVAVGGYSAYGGKSDFAMGGESLHVSAQAETIATASGESGLGGWTGTSFSAPQVSALVALMYEANAGLGYRDVQEILVSSARMVGQDFATAEASAVTGSFSFNATGTWNGGGMHFSWDYGFGIIDAHAAVRLAESWTQVSTYSNMESVGYSLGNTGTLEANTRGVSVDHDGRMVLDSVELSVSISHSDWADLVITITSPGGTQSVVFDGSTVQWGAYGSGFQGSGALSWTFTSNRFWGEDADGVWQVSVQDTTGGDTGSLSNWSLTLHGDTDDVRNWIYTGEFSDLNASGRTDLVAYGVGIVDTLNGSALTSDSVINLNPNAISTLDGVAVNVVSGSKVDNAIGGDGNDYIRGNYLTNILDGGRGDDQVYGHRGDGNVLIGGEGRDNLVGSTGADRFTFDDIANDGWDRVYAFQADRDMIDLRDVFADFASGSDFASMVKFTQRGNSVNLHVDFDGDADGYFSDDVFVAIIRDVLVSDLTLNDNVLVHDGSALA